MAFQTTSRSFTNLGPTAVSSDSPRNTSSSSSATITTNSSAANTSSTLGNGAGPWGNNASSIWGNGSVASTLSSRAATRDSSRSRDLKAASSVDHADTMDIKKGSGSLLASSESDSWSFKQSRGDSVPRISTQQHQQQQQRSASIVDYPGSLSNGSQNISPTTTRPPTINLTNNAFPHHRPSFNPTFSAGSIASEPPHVYPKYKDRQPSAYPPMDSSISPASTTPSPTTERKPQWPSHYRDTINMTTPRDHSRAPTSSHSDRQSTLHMPDYARSSQRQTPLSTRTPSSSSSQRNGSFAHFGSNSVDHLNSTMAQLNFGNNDERPQTASRHFSTAGFVPSQAGSSRDGRPDSATGFERSALAGSALEAFAGSHVNGYPPITHPSLLAGRIRDPSALDFRPGHTPLSDDVRTKSQDMVPGAKQSPLWHEASNSPLNPAHRSVSLQDPHNMLDPRLAAQVMAMKTPYSMYNPYDVPNPLAIGGVPQYLGYYPMGLAGLDGANTPRDFVTDGVQSAKLYEFKIAGKNNRRYELKDIYDHIAEFAGDQHGSRFIQTKLETANSDEKERVFREIEPNAIPLMTDVFGNYVIQKFFDHGHQEHKKVLANKMRGQVLNLSTQMYGCRVVQKALEHVLIEQQAALVGELEHHVLKCVKDQNGNHVIQKAIERCPTETISFVYQAFVGQVHSLSLHPYGCRVIQRCLERPEWFPAKQVILGELHENMPKGMIGDQYGNYVVQHVVEKCSPHDRQHVLNIIISSLEDYSKHKFASNVVEKCIEHSDDAWRRRVVDILVSQDQRRSEGESSLVILIKDSFGNYVIQKLLDRLTPQDYVYFHQHLQPAMTHAKRTGSGKQVLSIEKKMHRFPFQQQQNPAFHLSLPNAFASTYGSVANTPPPLTSDSQSLQSSSIPSINGDAIEGAPISSRKGSEPCSDGNMLR